MPRRAPLCADSLPMPIYCARREPASNPSWDQDRVLIARVDGNADKQEQNYISPLGTHFFNGIFQRPANSVAHGGGAKKHM